MADDKDAEAEAETVKHITEPLPHLSIPAAEMDQAIAAARQILILSQAQVARLELLAAQAKLMQRGKHH